MIGNYKGLAFKNTLGDFKRWCREFPSIHALETLDVRCYKARGTDYYMEIRLVEHWSEGQPPQVVAQYRQYDPETKNFRPVPVSQNAEMLELFKYPIEWFREAHRSRLV